MTSFPQPPISLTQPSPLLPAIQAWAEEGGMTAADDPLTRCLFGLAGQGDRMERILKDFGPGAAKQAAEAARREVAIGMGNLKRAFSWLGAGLILAGGAAFFTVGLLLGQSQQVATPLGPMPPDMAHVVGLQDWEAQWDACKIKIIRQGDVDWCYMPVVMKIKRVGT